MHQLLMKLLPQHRAPEEINICHLWAFTARCPYCEGLVAVSPKCRLAADGTGVWLVPRCVRFLTVMVSLVEGSGYG